MLTICKFKKLRESAKIPTYESTNAAGADLYACTDVLVTEIPPHATVMIPLGIASEFEPGHAAFLYARSGLASKQGLAPANKVGVVDADYRGEWKLAIHNHSNEPQIIEDGQRIGQVVFQEVETPAFITTDELSDTARGIGGFGSTDHKK